MIKTFLPNLLTVGCWNIEGIYGNVNGVKLSKVDEEIFQGTLKKFDILRLQETHTGCPKKKGPKVNAYNQGFCECADVMFVQI